MLSFFSISQTRWNCRPSRLKNHHDKKVTISPFGGPCPPLQNDLCSNPFDINLKKYFATITKEDQVIAMVQAALETFGKIDILINNAGIAYRIPATETTLEQWHQTI
ncbi:MAG: SDR family oxidoreductase [Desulfobacterales bacterium]|nr:MAG: SDR family oxidoreductase [Desulfobacterales bacterium]